MDAMHPAPTPDPAELEFSAELLRAQSGLIADLAARHLTAAHPDLVARWGRVGGMAKSTWSGALRARLEELTAAVAAGRPDLFASQLAWAHHAFRARGLRPTDLALGLESLRSAIFATLPESEIAAVLPALEAGRAALANPSPEPPAQITASTPRGLLAARLLCHILEGDRRAACAVIADAVHDGALTVPEAYTHVFAPALREMGRMWQLGEVNVAEEHFATATVLQAMSQILPLWARKPANGKTVLAAAVDGNTHEVGVRMTADFFEAAGWRAIYLGPSVPAEDLACAIDDYAADVVCLGVTLPSHLQSLRDTIRTLRALATRKPPIIAGGPALAGDHALACELGADALASTPDDAIAFSET